MGSCHVLDIHNVPHKEPVAVALSVCSIMCSAADVGGGYGGNRGSLPQAPSVRGPPNSPRAGVIHLLIIHI